MGETPRGGGKGDGENLRQGLMWKKIISLPFPYLPLSFVFFHQGLAVFYNGYSDEMANGRVVMYTGDLKKD